MRKKAKTALPQRSVPIVGNQGALSTTLTHLLCVTSGSAGRGEVVEAGQALQWILRSQPDIVLVDMPKPSRAWIVLIKQVKTADSKIKVLAVCGQDDPVAANRVLRAGADGYVVQQESADEILNAIDDVLAGALYVSESVLTASSKSRRLFTAKSRPARSASRDYDTSFWRSLDRTIAVVKSPAFSI